MLTVIICLIIIVSLFKIARKVKSSNYHFIIFVVGYIAILVIMANGVMGVGWINGYTEWTLQQEFPLASLDDPKHEFENTIYVLNKKNKTYICRYAVDINSNNKDDSEKNRNEFIMGKVEVIQSSDCKIPILQYYIRNVKPSIWTFGLKQDEKYVFRIPKGSVKNINP